MAQVKFSPTQMWHNLRLGNVIAMSTEPILAEGLPIEAPTLSKEEKHTILYKYHYSKNKIRVAVLKVVSAADRLWFTTNEHQTTIKMWIRFSNGTIRKFEEELDDYILQISVNKVLPSRVLLIGIKKIYEVRMLKDLLQITPIYDNKDINMVLQLDDRYDIILPTFNDRYWFKLVLRSDPPVEVLERRYLVPDCCGERFRAHIQKISRVEDGIEIELYYRGNIKKERLSLLM